MILGVSCAFWHDPAAGLLVDGKVVAAAEQERFSRHKHAPRELPVDAVRFCLDHAGIAPADVDVVAYPWSVAAIRSTRIAYARRNWRRLPRRTLRLFTAARRLERRAVGKLHRTLEAVGFPPGTPEVACVEHHMAHATSAYLFSGFDEAAVLSIDGMGETVGTLFARAKGPTVRKIAEIHEPDSLGLFYQAMTDYLGFRRNSGEYKVMGMAAYGDPHEADLSGIVECRDGDLELDLDYCWPPPEARFEGRRFGRKLVERLGPPRSGEGAEEPHVHIAAATQHVFEEATLARVDAADLVAGVGLHDPEGVVLRQGRPWPIGMRKGHTVAVCGAGGAGVRASLLSRGSLASLSRWPRRWSDANGGAGEEAGTRLARS